MKSIEKLFLCLLATILYISSAYSSDFTRQPSGFLATRVKKVIYTNGNSSYSVEHNVDYGTYIFSSGTKALHRSIWEFALPTDLPTGAFAKKVELYYNGNSPALTSFLLSHIQTYSPNQDYEEQWNSAENGTYLCSAIGSNGTLKSVEVTDLPAIIRNALETNQSKIYLSFKAGSDYSGTNLVTLSELSIKITFDIRFKYTIKNNFGTGLIIVNENTTNSGLEWYFPEQSSNSFQAIEPQSSGGYNYLWNDTEKPNFKSNWILKSSNNVDFPKGENFLINLTAISSEHNSTITANLRKFQNVTFSNSLPGTAENGNITVDNISYTAPTNQFLVVEQNNISVAAQYTYDFGGSLFYEFSNWSDGPTQVSRNITASQTQNYTAVYKRIPKFSEGLYRNLTYSFPYHANLRLSWSEHPDPNVTQYQIWQKIKKINGVNQPQIPQLIATVNRGVTSYTHPILQQLQGVDFYEVYFDVKAYYAPDGTTSWDDWILVSAWSNQQDKVNGENTEESQVIKEYSISNYPNPFNPTTNIEYAIKEDGFVTIKVFDVLGNEIAELVNEPKIKGRYTAEFNASNLPSGVYLYSMQVNTAAGGSTFRSTKKMILAK